MYYHHIVNLHRVLVTVFLLHYIWKAFLLVTNKKETLASYTAATRVIEMIVAAGFLITGGWLILKGPDLSMLQYIKIVLVLLSIPIAIIGFKRGIKAMGVTSVLFLFAAYGLAEADHAKYKKEDKAPVTIAPQGTDSLAVGRAIYTEKCTACHGDAGDAGLGGAKNLRTTQLTTDQQKDVIKNGRSGTEMNAFKGLTDDQLNNLVAYVKTLKQ